MPPSTRRRGGPSGWSASPNLATTGEVAGRLAGERRKTHYEDRPGSISFVNQLAFVPAYEALLYELTWNQGQSLREVSPSSLSLW